MDPLVGVVEAHLDDEERRDQDEPAHDQKRHDRMLAAVGYSPGLSTLERSGRWERLQAGEAASEVLAGE